MPPTIEIDYPVLGEPVAIELANTRYHETDGVVDYLATPTLASGWFDASPTASSLLRPGRWTRSDLAELLVLRDAIDDLLRAIVEESTGDARSVSAVNRAAARARVHAELTWQTGQAPQRLDRRDSATSVDAVLAVIATDAITLLASPTASSVQVCANADCEMLFVRNHHRRRWCHNSCGHRHRQADYYRRTHLRLEQQVRPAVTPIG
jgi:predicted RNA-binding Zn ribbon-like protein